MYVLTGYRTLRGPSMRGRLDTRGASKGMGGEVARVKKKKRKRKIMHLRFEDAASVLSEEHW